jgi:hypothetical protein
MVSEESNIFEFEEMKSKIIFFFGGGDILGFYSYLFNTALFAAPHILLCRWMLGSKFERRTVATLALAISRSNHSARSPPQLG